MMSTFQTLIKAYKNAPYKTNTEFSVFLKKMLGEKKKNYYYRI